MNDVRSTVHFRSLKGKYAGRRGFVIGNGPSLCIDDLARLTDEITVASNQIYLAFDKTPWRPTFYTIEDAVLWDKIRGGHPQVASHRPQSPHAGFVGMPQHPVHLAPPRKHPGVFESTSVQRRRDGRSVLGQHRHIHEPAIRRSSRIESH